MQCSELIMKAQAACDAMRRTREKTRKMEKLECDRVQTWCVERVREREREEVVK